MNLSYLKKVHFRSVRGYLIFDSQWQREADALDALISSKGLEVDSEEFYINGYNSPMEIWNRRNEVWKVKKDE